MHNFIEQNYLTVERSIPYINYQWEVAIKNDFGKKTAENPKIEKLLEKRQKNNKKIKRYVLSLNLKRIIKQKHCGVKFRKLNLNMSSNKILFQQKNQITRQKTGPITRKNG